MRKRLINSKSIILFSVVLTLLMSLLSPVLSNIVLAEEEFPNARIDRKMITAPGFFTKEYFFEKGNCDYQAKEAKTQKDRQADEAEESKLKSQGMDNSVDVADSDDAKETGAVKDLLGTVTESVVSSDKDSNKGILNINCGEYSFVSHLLKIEEPVNITQSSVIMGIVYDFQIVALGIGVLLIAIFGLYYALGNETTDPIKFLIRGFFVLWFVYYLPYFAQDILNINNMITYWIMTGDLPNVDGTAATSVAVVAFSGMVSMLLQALVTAMMLTGPAAGALIGLLFLVAVMGFILKAVFTMLFWWYFRFLMIMFLVCLGPLFMIMMILPQTAHYGKNWIQYFIGETFTQASWAIAIYFSASLTSQLGKLNEETGTGMFGSIILMVGIFKLLEKIPNMSKSLIGRDIGGIGWEDAKRSGAAVGDFVKNAGVAMAGMAASRINAARLGKEQGELQGLENRLAQEKDTLNEDDRTTLEEQRDALKDKISNRASRGEIGRRFMSGLNSGDFSKAMEDIDGQNKRAEEKAKGDIEQKTLNKLHEQSNELAKAKNDATEAEVKADLQKEALGVNEAYNSKVRSMEEKKANLQKAGKWDDDDEKKFQSDKEGYKYQRDKQLEKIQQRGEPENVKAEVAKRKADYQSRLENIASDMLGNQFKNEFEKKAAVASLADTLDREVDKVLDRNENAKLQKKLEKTAEVGKDLAGASANYAEIMSNSADELADKFNISKGQAAELLAKSAELDKINKTDLSSMAPEAQAEMQKRQSELQRGINDIVNGANPAIETRRAEMDSLNKDNAHLLNANPEMLSAEQQEQRKQVLTRRSQLQNEIKDIEAGNAPGITAKRAELNNFDRKNALLLNSNPETLTADEQEQRKQIVNRRAQLQSELNDIVNSSAPELSAKRSELSNLNSQNASLLNASPETLSAEQNEQRKQVVNRRAQLESEINDISSSSNPGLTAKKLELNNLNANNATLLNSSPETLSTEQSEQRKQIINRRSQLESEINSIENPARGISGAVAADMKSLKDSHQAFNQANDNYKQTFESGVSELSSNHGINRVQAATVLNNSKELASLQSANAELLTADRSTLSDDQKATLASVEKRQNALQKEIRTVVGNNDSLGDAVSVQMEKISAASNGVQKAEVNYNEALSGSLKGHVEKVNLASEQLGKSQAEYTKSIPDNLRGNSVPSASDIHNSSAISQVVQSSGGFGKVISQVQTPEGSRSFEQVLSASGVTNSPEIVKSLQNNSDGVQKIIDATISDGSGQTRSSVIQHVSSIATSGMNNVSIETKSEIGNSIGDYAWNQIQASIPIETKIDTAFGGQGAIEIVQSLANQQLTVETLTHNLTEAGVPNANAVATTLNAYSGEISSMVSSNGTGTGASPNTKNQLYSILKGIKDPQVSDAVVESVLKGIKNTGNDGNNPSNPNLNPFDVN